MPSFSSDLPYRCHLQRGREEERERERERFRPFMLVCSNAKRSIHHVVLQFNEEVDYKACHKSNETKPNQTKPNQKIKSIKLK
jgi:hypothetical protein